MLNTQDYEKALQRIQGDISDSLLEVEYLKRLLEVKPPSSQLDMVEEIRRNLRCVEDDLAEQQEELKDYQSFVKIDGEELQRMIELKISELTQQASVVEKKQESATGQTIQDKITLKVLAQVEEDIRKDLKFLKLTLGISTSFSQQDVYLRSSVLTKMQNNLPL